MQERWAAPIEQILEQSEQQLYFLTKPERLGGWRTLFGEAGGRFPEPVLLYGEDEKNPVVLGFPILLSPGRESALRELERLVRAEASYRVAAAGGDVVDKSSLVGLRAAFAQRVAGLLENAFVHDYGRRMPEVLWLMLSRDIAEAVESAMRGLAEQSMRLESRTLDEIRYAIAKRLADIAHRGEADALSRIRKIASFEKSLPSVAFGRILREDLLPFADPRMTADLRQLDSLLHGHFRFDAARFHQVIESTTTQLERLRQRDPAFDRVLGLFESEAPTLPRRQLMFSSPVLSLLETWGHGDTPRLSADFMRLLKDLSERVRRFEVVACLRNRVFSVNAQGSRFVTRAHGQPVRLSAFTRPLDFTSPGIVESAARRYGLLYDLVEFTHVLEELRRRGRNVEDVALRALVTFQHQVELIRAGQRMRFEKFMGDGAFYSARSAVAILQGATQLRLLYERLRGQGFPFDRGLRLALNVGVYHLLPMGTTVADEPVFEFFGHGLVELARLTTGKTTQEVEDIADFLIASGYDVHRVLEFLEPVRQGPRLPRHLRERPYAAYLAENGELVNLGGVVTEAFLRDLETELTEYSLAFHRQDEVRWVLLRQGDARSEGPWIGLRALGTARLKGLGLTPLAELVVFERTLGPIEPLPADATLLQSLYRAAGTGVETAVQPSESKEEALDPRLCVVTALDGAASRAWYIGLFEEEHDALEHAFRVPFQPPDLKEGEPFESWLFGRRGELAKLYQGLCRTGDGATVPLDAVRGREGYVTCLLVAPHRSPR